MNVIPIHQHNASIRLEDTNAPARLIIESQPMEKNAQVGNIYFKKKMFEKINLRITSIINLFINCDGQR